MDQTSFLDLIHFSLLSVVMFHVKIEVLSD